MERFEAVWTKVLETFAAHRPLPPPGEAVERAGWLLRDAGMGRGPGEGQGHGQRGHTRVQATFVGAPFDEPQLPRKPNAVEAPGASEPL